MRFNIKPIPQYILLMSYEGLNLLKEEEETVDESKQIASTFENHLLVIFVKIFSFISFEHIFASVIRQLLPRLIDYLCHRCQIKEMT